jgi:hypothetical protein
LKNTASPRQLNGVASGFPTFAIPQASNVTPSQGYFTYHGEFMEDTRTGLFDSAHARLPGASSGNLPFVIFDQRKNS